MFSVIPADQVIRSLAGTGIMAYFTGVHTDEAAPRHQPAEWRQLQAPERVLPSFAPTPLFPNRHGGHRPSGRGIPGSDRRGKSGKPRRNSLRNRTGPATGGGNERGSVRNSDTPSGMTGIRRDTGCAASPRGSLQTFTLLQFAEIAVGADFQTRLRPPRRRR